MTHLSLPPVTQIPGGIFSDGGILVGGISIRFYPMYLIALSTVLKVTLLKFDPTKYVKVKTTRTVIWSLTNKGTDYKLKWNIIDRARLYRPGKRTCNLCMSEKFHILVGTNLINKKTESRNRCPHRRKFLARNHKP